MASLRYGKKNVDKVRVVVHDLGAGPNSTLSDNHWSIYLLTADGFSVHMNMTAGLEDPTGHLEWTLLDCALPNSAIMHRDYQAKADTTVDAIQRLIYQKHRDRYTMAGGVSCCRWWIYVVMHDFAKTGFLSLATAAAELLPNLLLRYSSTGPPIALAMVKGTFDSFAPSQSTLAATSSSSTPTRRLVEITDYMANNQLCYTWNLDDQVERSFATDWSIVAGTQGKFVLLHKTKLLMARPS